MSGERTNWLDALARGSASPPASARQKREPAPVPADEERFSRSTAVRLALAGSASLALGLLRVPRAPAAAATYAECYDGCSSAYENALGAELDLCAATFAGFTFNRSPDWVFALRLLPSSSTWVGNALAEMCMAAAYAHSRANFSGCTRHCRDTCRHTQSRSLQSLSASCTVTPPPDSHPPEIPPAPTGMDDECLSCGDGGFCCPGGPTGFCGCATRCGTPGECDEIGYVDDHVPCGPCD